MQIDVATSGFYTGDGIKRAPDGLGLYGSGGLYQQPYVDRYRKIRTPTAYDLVAQYRNAVYVCSNLNANAGAQCARRLYVQTKKGDAKPKVRTRGLARKQEDWIRRKAASALVGRVEGDADVEEVLSHPLLDLLAKPNPFFDGHSLNKTTYLYLDISGAAYWYIGERSRLGTPKEIWPLPAQQVWPWRDKPNDDKVVDTWLFTSGRQQYRFPYKDVLQFRNFNPYEPYSVPYSPLYAVYEHVTVTEQSLGHAQSLFDNQARFDALVTPNDVIGEVEGKRLEMKLNNKFRGAGYGSVLVTESAFKVQPMQWSPVDLGILELYGVTYEMICDAYGVPQAMVTKETNLANLEASLTQHAMFAVIPRLNMTDESINRVLIPLYDDTGRLFVASDNPVKEDRKAIVDEMGAWLGAGVATRSEARVVGGFEPEPWADVPLMPSNMNPVGPDGKPELPEPVGGPNGTTTGGGAKPKPGANGGAGQGAGRKPKKPKDGNGPKKSLVDDLARLGKAVARGSLPAQTAAWALSQDHPIQRGEAAHYLSQISADPAAAQLKAALAFAHQPDMDDQTERRVADLWQQKSHDHIDWIAPDLDSKKNQNEIARACQSVKLEPVALTELLKTGELIDLKDKTWKRITNSDSLKVSRLRDVIELAGRDKKKVKNLLGEFLEGRIRAPIVLGMPDGSHLINGNTRLCLAQVFKVRPKVWFARLEKEKTAPDVDWRAKGLEAAFAKLAALPDVVPVPFVVGSELPAGEPGGSPEKVLLRDLISVVPEVSATDVRAALESAPDMAVVQASDGQRYIKHGLAGFVAAWLRGEEEVEAGMELVKNVTDASGHEHDAIGQFTGGGKPGEKPKEPDEYSQRLGDLAFINYNDMSQESHPLNAAAYAAEDALNADYFDDPAKTAAMAQACIDTSVERNKEALKHVPPDKTVSLDSWMDRQAQALQKPAADLSVKAQAFREAEQTMTDHEALEPPSHPPDVDYPVTRPEPDQEDFASEQEYEADMDKWEAEQQALVDQAQAEHDRLVDAWKDEHGKLEIKSARQEEKAQKSRERFTEKLGTFNTTFADKVMDIVLPESKGAKVTCTDGISVKGKSMASDVPFVLELDK